MANFAYILKEGISLDTFGAKLRAAMRRCMKPGWQTENFEQTWVVYIPGTATSTGERYWTAPDEDIGFLVTVDENGLAFRHGPNSPFVRWAQGCLEEELADYYGVGVYFDAIDETYPPGTRKYRVSSKNYSDYFLQKITDPEHPVSKALIDRYREFTPEGYW